MGIHCEINLHKPENGAFIGTAGSVVSGLIKYAVDEETTFKKITISLKGMGTLHVNRNGGNKKKRKYHNSEIYIDMDHVVSKENIMVLVGSYEIPFTFVIPHNLPPTLAYIKRGHRYDVKCNITYYVRIKFNKPSFMNFAKRFKKEITVISGITPRLPTTPIIYGGQKKLAQLFTRSPRMIHIKANILKSVLRPSDKIVFVYEVINNTNLAIKAVETKLVEVYKFYIHEKEITRNEYDIPETDSKAGAIQRGETREMLVEINIPSDRESAEYSKLFSRDYYVSITVYLPIPHRNHVTQIPIQIGNSYAENAIEATCSRLVDEDEEPPSYWEAMKEYSIEKSDPNEEI